MSLFVCLFSYDCFFITQFTRTPERIPELIRPLDVCEALMSHLRNLLNKSYDSSAYLLAMHGFVCDRMRAIRMDLKMQHLFDDRSILMHEQMVSEIQDVQFSFY
jgi:nuclear mRNA export protein SAC3